MIHPDISSPSWQQDKRPIFHQIILIYPDFWDMMLFSHSSLSKLVILGDNADVLIVFLGFSLPLFKLRTQHPDKSWFLFRNLLIFSKKKKCNNPGWGTREMCMPLEWVAYPKSLGTSALEAIPAAFGIGLFTCPKGQLSWLMTVLNTA